MAGSRRILTAGILLLLLGFYAWTALSSATPAGVGDYYNELTDGVLEGRLSIAREPPAGLLALPNPYDPQANARFRIPPGGGKGVHDLSLHDGRLYLYWGPTPVLTAFLPARALGVRLSPAAATALFCGAGLLFSVALLRELRRRYAPRAPTWAWLLAVVALGLGNAAPFLLRRPAVYEVSIAAGFCFLFAGLWLLASGSLRAPPRRWRLAAGSLALGLAAAARIDLVLALAVPLGLLVLLHRRRGTRWTALAPALLGPAALVLAGLGVYNAARFGSPFDLGTSYVMGGYEQRALPIGSLGHLGPGLWAYVLGPPRLSLAFPFVHLVPPDYPGSLPAVYVLEPAGGLLTTLPAALLVGAAVWLPRRGGGRLAVAGLAGLGLTLLVALAFTIWTATQRYEMDYAGLLICAAMLAFLGALSALPSGRRRTALAVVATALVAWVSLVAVATSMTGYYDGLRGGSPGTYRALEEATAALPTAAATLAGRALLTETRPGAVTIASPADGRVTLRGVTAAGTPAELQLPVRRGVNRIALRGPSAPASGLELTDASP